MFLNVLQRRVLPLKQDPVEDDKDNTTQPTDVNNGNNNQQNVFIFIQILNNNNNNNTGTKNDCGVNGDTVDRRNQKKKTQKNIIESY